MLDEDFTREAFDVNMISRILGPRVGWSCIWVKRFEVVISMTACWMSWSFAEGLTELFSQFMSGQLKSPPRMTSTVFAPSCVSLSRDFFSSCVFLVSVRHIKDAYIEIFHVLELYFHPIHFAISDKI